MKEGDVIHVTMVSGSSNYFKKGKTYEAQIEKMFPDNGGNLYILVTDEYNEVHYSNMRKACVLNGGDFKINIGVVK